ncbi:MAG: transposase [Nitrospirae bacterium]|nr:transposase [Nitrospirota bacterium]
MKQFYSGIDLGSRESHICVINEDDKKLVDMKVDNDLSTIEALLSPYKRRLQVVVESTFNWDWIVYGLQDRGYDVKLAHVLGLKAITWSKKKTDKWDAFILARLLRSRMIPEAYIYPKETRPLRELLRDRMRLSQKRASEYGSNKQDASEAQHSGLQ